MNAKLKDLYKEIADLTKPRCASCVVPLSCCDQMYCEMAIEYAKEQGVDLARTEHEKLPLMGKEGCTAAPHLRPLCSVHVCERRYASDPKFAKAYFKLRDKITEIEWTEEVVADV